MNSIFSKKDFAVGRQMIHLARTERNEAECKIKEIASRVSVVSTLLALSRNLVGPIPKLSSLLKKIFCLKIGSVVEKVTWSKRDHGFISRPLAFSNEN